MALPVVALAIAIAQPVINFRNQDKSKSVEIHDFLKAILDSAPPQAHCCSRQGDYMFHGLRYMQIVERISDRRPRPGSDGARVSLASASRAEVFPRRDLPRHPDVATPHNAPATTT